MAERVPTMSRTAADNLAMRLENDEAVIKSETEQRLIVAALRYYAKH